jgi:hypothetical protein
MITNPGKILNPAAPDQNHRVFLEIMTYTWNIRGYFRSMGKPYTGYLAEC